MWGRLQHYSSCKLCGDITSCSVSQGNSKCNKIKFHVRKILSNVERDKKFPWRRLLGWALTTGLSMWTANQDKSLEISMSFFQGRGHQAFNMNFTLAYHSCPPSLDLTPVFGKSEKLSLRCEMGCQKLVLRLGNTVCQGMLQTSTLTHPAP